MKFSKNSEKVKLHPGVLGPFLPPQPSSCCGSTCYFNGASSAWLACVWPPFFRSPRFSPALSEPKSHEGGYSCTQARGKWAVQSSHHWLDGLQLVHPVSPHPSLVGANHGGQEVGPKGHLVQCVEWAEWAFWSSTGPVGPGDLEQSAVRPCPASDPEANDSTSHLSPSGHTGFLLFSKHTKPGSASGLCHFPWDTVPETPAWFSLHCHLGWPGPSSEWSPWWPYKNYAHSPLPQSWYIPMKLYIFFKHLSAP